jgi:hypothetical protein
MPLGLTFFPKPSKKLSANDANDNDDNDDIADKNEN